MIATIPNGTVLFGVTTRAVQCAFVADFEVFDAEDERPQPIDRIIVCMHDTVNVYADELL